jgi:hypothetical protein
VPVVEVKDAVAVADVCVCDIVVCVAVREKTVTVVSVADVLVPLV